MRAIEFIDLVMLWCILEWQREDASRDPLSIRNMMLYANKFLATHGIEPDRANPIHSMDKAQKSLKKWQLLGFLTPERKVTSAAVLFFIRYRGWTEWPVEIPLMLDEDGVYLDLSVLNV